MNPKEFSVKNQYDSLEVPHERRLVRRRRSLTMLVSLLLVASVFGPTPANAAPNYPDWGDVEAAKQNEATKNAEIEKLNTLISELQVSSDALRKSANEAASKYEAALQVALEAEQKSADLDVQLTEAESTAADSKQQAGSLFARMGRMNSTNVSLELFLDSDASDDTLYKLSAMAKFTERSAEVLQSARQDANQVSSVTAQAKVAAQTLEEAKAEAEAQLAVAQTAADTALVALQEQQARESTLVEQLAFLKDTRASVERDYLAGVAARKAAAEAAAAEAARKAAAAAAARGGSSGGSGGGSGGSGGGSGGGSSSGGSGTAGSYFVPSSQGWWRPLPGPVTSQYGPRRIICNSAGCSSNHHAGVDLAGSCGTQIRSVAAGRVVSARNAGGFGNRVIVDHGGGVQSIYGHMQTGSFRVSAGQQIPAGTFIGGVGDTGVVTGCHLDIKMTVNGGEVNPSTFLRGRGVNL
jgi:murein DD-endopeptidase MepM/ murein hydrolase activator NlpD